jgi:methionyl-tRNA synthetase
MSKELAIDELAVALRAHLQLSEVTTPAAVAVVNLPPKAEAKTAPADGAPKIKKEKTPKEAVPAATNAAPTAVKEPAYERWSLKDDASLDYGYLAKTSGAGIQETAKAVEEDSKKKGYYITTAINYTNGPAHMGHAYEAATADVIARFHRLEGEGESPVPKPTYFVTGADEHGQKIANTAAEIGKEPIEICDQYVTGFQVLKQRTLISYDDYVRTTSPRHKRTAQELWRRCDKAGDIYLDNYSGWYNIREETFVTENDAALSDYKDPTSGVPLKQVEEASYFFKMSEYNEMLIKHIEDNPEFILPERHRNQILQRLRSDGLRDLSISRTTFSWGIHVPEGFDANHVMYVWMDALSNYLTGVNGLGANDDGSLTGLERFWPADVHIIGKDILWFHTVIWPCLLMSAGLALPKTIFAHGFVNDKEGKKMSKTMGNVIDPHDMLDKFDVDTFRW